MNTENYSDEQLKDVIKSNLLLQRDCAKRNIGYHNIIIERANIDRLFDAVKERGYQEMALTQIDLAINNLK